MKKIYNIILLLTALGLLWSCQDEDRLVLQQPDTFTLNVPKYASGIYDLQNLDAIEFTTSQPGYGFTAAANYSVEISLNQDFSNSIALPGSHTSAKFNVEAIDMALALMELHGVELEEDYPTSPHPVYVRLTSVLNDKNIGAVKSNIIELPHVKGYFALDPVVMPEDMYIIGNVAGDWNWDNSTEMIPVWGTPGKFWAVQYLGQSGGGENAQIKFNFAKDWNGNEFGYEGCVECILKCFVVALAHGDGRVETKFIFQVFFHELPCYFFATFEHLLAFVLHGLHGDALVVVVLELEIVGTTSHTSRHTTSVVVGSNDDESLILVAQIELVCYAQRVVEVEKFLYGSTSIVGM